MAAQTHTVLGASGAMGRAIIAELTNRKLLIRAVNRSGSSPGVETINIDLLDRDCAVQAISGSTYVYLCVGLEYRTDVWERDWPVLMANVIEACEATSAILVFFDNVYMYAKPLSVPFDEHQLQQPETRKGLARKQTVDILLNAVKENRVQAVIGRSADFYGPGAVNSPFYTAFLENMLRGKKPMALGKLDVRHTYAYTMDNGRALVELALDRTTYGQVWHLPVSNPITVEEVTTIFNGILSNTYKPEFLQPFSRKVLSLFMPPLREVGEMLYQFENDYILSCEKFMAYFPDFKITPYEEGIKEMVRSFKTDRPLIR